MESNRESDARIAELRGHKVEWRWCQQYPNEYEPEEIEHLYSEEGAQWGNGPEDLEAEIASGQWDIHKEPCIKVEGHYEIVPHYTTDISAAMSLWDEMRGDENSDWFRLLYWSFGEWEFSADDKRVYGKAETAEIAICEAYKEWKSG